MFGYIKEHDSRNEQHKLRLFLDPLIDFAFPTGAPEGNRHYRQSPILDQGNTGTCVAHGGTALIEGAPIVQKRPMSPFDLYRKVVLNDEWGENDTEARLPDSQLIFGTSALALMKTFKQLGYVDRYLWAEDAVQCRDYHLLKGAMGFGIIWKTDMMQTDSEGFVSYSGNDEGGHFFKSTGWNDFVKHNGRRVPAVRLQNSWGTSWGQRGRFWMSMDDLQKAIADGGDAVAMLEIRVKLLETVV